MTVAHELPREIAAKVETTFVDTVPDWSSAAYFFYATDIDTSGVKQQVAPNENNVRRPLATHQHIKTLRTCSASFGTYLHAKPTAAAEASAATTFHLAELGQAFFGGRDLGWGIGLASDEAEEDDELQLDADPGYVQSDWVFAYDTSEAWGTFHRFESIDAGPPVTATLDRDREFTVDTGGGDRAYAVIDLYLHGYAITQHDHASHKTLQLIVQGDQAEDAVVILGCKPTLTIEPIAAGTPLKLKFDLAVTTFQGPDEATKDDFGSAVPVGEAPLVPGKGARYRVLIADFGSPLADSGARGQVTIVPGVGYKPVEAVCPYGVRGYVADVTADTTVEIMVPFDDDWATKFRAGTYLHALVEITEGINAIAFYFPKLEIADDPGRNDEGSLAGCTLSLRAHENSAASVLTGDNLEKHRSRMHLLIRA